MNASAIESHTLELLNFAAAHGRNAEALARATGEHFNIFQILRVGHLEVTTHSPILGELLNPKGKHGQGATFLRLFLRACLENSWGKGLRARRGGGRGATTENIPRGSSTEEQRRQPSRPAARPPLRFSKHALSKFGIKNFDAESEAVTMELEYWAGQVTEKSGGRFDIVLKDGKGASIFIENKIYAADQENQMERYRDFDAKAHLFYLTLFGDMPKGFTTEKLEEMRCTCISYAKHILAWLTACRNESACLPHVRETLSQYIRLIEELTNQRSTRMNNELISEIVKSKESLAAFFTLCDEGEAVRAALMAELQAKVAEFAAAVGVKLVAPQGDLDKAAGGFYFTTPGLESSHLQIGFAFDKANYGAFDFGFAKKDPAQNCPVAEQLVKALKNEFPVVDSTDYWPAFAAWENPYRNWGREAFEGVRSGYFAAELRARLEKLAKIARRVCPDEAHTL